MDKQAERQRSLQLSIEASYSEMKTLLHNVIEGKIVKNDFSDFYRELLKYERRFIITPIQEGTFPDGKVRYTDLSKLEGYEPEISEEEYNKLYYELIKSGMFNSLLQISDGVKRNSTQGDLARLKLEKIRGTNGIDKQVLNEIVNIKTLEKVDHIAKKNVIAKTVFSPFTKRDILNVSVGEITTPVKRKNQVTDADIQSNTVFSNIMFGSKSGNHANDIISSPRGKNYAHIMLSLPVVHPDKILTTRNYLKTLMGLEEGSPLVNLINYKSFIAIPKTQNWYEYYKDEYEQLLQDKDNYKLIKLPRYTRSTENTGSYVKVSMNFPVIDYNIISASKTDTNYMMLSNMSVWESNNIILTGVYALVYLLAHIDVEETLDCGFKYLEQERKSKRLTPVKLAELSESLTMLRNAVKGEGTLLDVITNVIPVIPVLYRDFEEVRVGNTSRVREDKFNSMYNTILEKNAEIRKKIQDSIIPYEMLYTCTQEMATLKRKHGNLPIDKLEYMKKIELFLTDEISKIPRSQEIRNAQRSIQECLHQYICSVKTTDAKVVSQLSKLGGKYGDIRAEGSSKREDYTGRTVITSDPTLELNQIGIPYDILKIWFGPVLENYVRSKERWSHTQAKRAKQKKWIKYLSSTEEVNMTSSSNAIYDISMVTDEIDEKELNGVERDKRDRARVEQLTISKLKEILAQVAVLSIRYPSLWKFNELAMKPVLVTDLSIHLHPLVCSCYNADFDGDTMAVFLIELEKAVKEAYAKMLPTKNVTDANGDVLLSPSQDAIAGIYYLTLQQNTKDANPKLDKNKMIEEFVNKRISEYNATNPGVEVTEQIVQQFVTEANNEPNIKNTSKVVAYFNSYDEMYAKYKLGELKLTDKVSVKLPRYDNSIFMQKLSRRNNLKKKDSDRLSSGYLKYTCKPMTLSADNFITEDGTIDFMSDVRKLKTTGESLPEVEVRPNESVVSKSLENDLFNFQELLRMAEEGTEDLVDIKEVSFMPDPTNEIDVDEFVPMMDIVSIVGRFIFNANIPQTLGMYNRVQSNPRSLYELEIDYDIVEKQYNTTGVNKKIVSKILETVVASYEEDIMAHILDSVMRLGYEYATVSGLSLSLSDLTESPMKPIIIKEYQEKVKNVKANPALSDKEKFDKSIALWNECTETVQNDVIGRMELTNPLGMMCFSGARGSVSQLSQILGMRGIMLDPNGDPVETPIFNGLTEGLTSQDYSVSSYGACKGMIDRANKTKYTGALTRDVIFGTSDIVIASGDCGDTEGTLLPYINYINYNVDSLSGIGYIESQTDIDEDTNEIKIRNEALVMDRVLILGDSVITNSNGVFFYKGITPIYNIKSNRILNAEIFNYLKDFGAFNVITSTGTCRFDRITSVYFNADILKNGLVDEDKILYNSIRCNYCVTLQTLENELLKNVEYAYQINMSDDLGVNLLSVFNSSPVNIIDSVVNSVNTGVFDLNTVVFREYKKYTNETGYAYLTHEKKDELVLNAGRVVTSGKQIIADFTAKKPDTSIERDFKYSNTVSIIARLDKGVVSVIHDGEVLYQVYGASLNNGTNDNNEYFTNFKINSEKLNFYPFRGILDNDSTGQSYIAYDGKYYYNRDIENGITHITTEPFNPDYKYRFTPTAHSIVTASGEDICVSEYMDIFQDIQGRFFSEDIYDKYTGELLVSHETPLIIGTDVEKSILKRINDEYTEGVYLRSPYSCKSPGKICSKCYGYYYASNRFSQMGDLVGATASHVFGEFLSQSTMRTFHTGGAALAGDVGDTFKATQDILISSTIADSYIDSLLQNILFISTEEKQRIIDETMKIKEFYTVDKSGNPMFTGYKQTLNGKPITLETYGVAKLGTYYEICNYLTTRLKSIFKIGGKFVKSIHYETVIKAMLQHLVVVDGGQSSKVINESITLNELIKNNVDLVMRGLQPIIAVPSFTGIRACASSPSHPMLATQYAYVTKTIGALSINNSEDDMTNPIAAVFSGNSSCYEEGLCNPVNKFTRISKSETLDDMIANIRTKAEKSANTKYNILEFIEERTTLPTAQVYAENIPVAPVPEMDIEPITEVSTEMDMHEDVQAVVFGSEQALEQDNITEQSEVDIELDKDENQDDKHVSAIAFGTFGADISSINTSNEK